MRKVTRNKGVQCYPTRPLPIEVWQRREKSWKISGSWVVLCFVSLWVNLPVYGWFDDVEAMARASLVCNLLGIIWFFYCEMASSCHNSVAIVLSESHYVVCNYSILEISASLSVSPWLLTIPLQESQQMSQEIELSAIIQISWKTCRWYNIGPYVGGCTISISFLYIRGWLVGRNYDLRAMA